MDVFVPGLRVGSVCVLQMRKRSQNSLGVRLLTAIHWKGGSWDPIAACLDILEFEEGCVSGIGIFLFPKHALLGVGKGISLGTVSTVVLWCVICQSSFHLIPLMSSDPFIFILASMLQRIKTKSHSGDVPGGPFWEISLALESTRALPAPDPSWPACFSYPKEGAQSGSHHLAEDCCWIVFKPAKANKFVSCCRSWICCKQEGLKTVGWLF